MCVWAGVGGGGSYPVAGFSERFTGRVSGWNGMDNVMIEFWLIERLIFMFCRWLFTRIDGALEGHLKNINGSRNPESEISRKWIWWWSSSSSVRPTSMPKGNVSTWKTSLVSRRLLLFLHHFRRRPLDRDLPHRHKVGNYFQVPLRDPSSRFSCVFIRRWPSWFSEVPWDSLWRFFPTRPEEFRSFPVSWRCRNPLNFNFS